MDLIQLHQNDYEEAIDFINMVFSMDSAPTNFPELLPAYYQPTETHMKCHFAIKSQGKIQALAGIYPGVLKVGDTSLKLARIGAVSTHPYNREHGLMQTLVNHCTAWVRNEGFDLSHLGGLRHRYLYFGYEKCGYKLVFTINRHNLKHHPSLSPQGLEIRPLTDEDELLTGQLITLHDRQIIHAERPAGEFQKFCRNWNHVLYVAFEAQKPVGYLAANKEGNHIFEIMAVDDLVAARMVAGFLHMGNHESIDVELSPVEPALIFRFGTIAESMVIKDAHNWSVINWPLVLQSLLVVKNRLTPLLNGELVVGISGFGNLRLSVAGENVSCKMTDEEPALKLNPSVAMRLFFGPLDPALVVKLSGEARILKAWCPLPLWMSTQDFA